MSLKFSMMLLQTVIIWGVTLDRCVLSRCRKSLQYEQVDDEKHIILKQKQKELENLNFTCSEYRIYEGLPFYIKFSDVHLYSYRTL